MLNRIKKYFYVMVLFFGVSFSQAAHASMEVTLNGGMHFSSDIKISEVVQDTVNQEGNVWLFGLDMLYKLPAFGDNKCGIGLRWQHNTIMESNYELSGSAATSQNFNFYTNRIALLGSYRFLDTEKFFLGVMGAVDLWAAMRFDVDATEGSTSQRGFSFTDQRWLGTGQVGLEAGFKWTQSFFVRAELGYNHLSFNSFNADRDGHRCNDCVFTDNPEIDLKTFYATLGIGWFFI